MPGAEIIFTPKTIRDCIDVEIRNDFCLKRLRRTFATICPDIFEPMNAVEKSRSLDFANQILFEVGPETMRKPMGRYSWCFVNCAENKIPYSVLVLPSHRTHLSSYQPCVKDNVLTLNIEQAGLVAVSILNEHNKQVLKENSLMTPLARVFFSEFDITAIAAATNSTVTAVIATINASCQFGGHRLPDSVAAVGAVVAVVFAHNFKDRTRKRQYLKKVFIEYEVAGKIIDMKLYELYGSFVIGGLPRGFENIRNVKMNVRFGEIFMKKHNDLCLARRETMKALYPAAVRRLRKFMFQ